MKISEVLNGRKRSWRTDTTRPYRPHPQSAALLERAWSYKTSVPYDVSGRWIQYRLLQDGSVSSKDDFAGLADITAVARTRCYGEWRPDSLVDDTRELKERGHGFIDLDSWLDEIPNQVYFKTDCWASQPSIPLVLYEARAMAGQFDHHLPLFVPRVPFGGDPSIALKWKTAQYIKRLSEEYEKPVHVLYYGDWDDKGEKIPFSALAGISAWSNVDFTYTRVGLNEKDAARFRIPENPERPGQFQWEALDDEGAQTLISEGLKICRLNTELAQRVNTENMRVDRAFGSWFRDIGATGFKEWLDGQGD